MFDRVKLDQLAHSQLEHVLLALRDGDGAYNIRDVLDPWWCYGRGEPFVKLRRGGGYSAIQFNNPCPWEGAAVLHQLNWVSKAAKNLMAVGQAVKKRKGQPDHLRLIVDHSVPLGYIWEALRASSEPWTADRLRSLLDSCFRRAVLTKAEDKMLTSAKLGSKMPAGWRFGDNPYQRYTAARIEGEEVK